MHLCCAAYKFYDTFISENWQDTATYFMIIVTGMIVYMSQHWLYAFDLRSEESMTTEQYQFQ